MAEIPIKLKQIIFRNDQIFVESADKSRFVDVKTEQDQGHLDYFIPGNVQKRSGQTERLPAEAILLRKDLPPLVRNHASRMKVPIRSEPASLPEAALARLYFGAGKALAEQALSELAKVLKTEQLRAEQPKLPKTGRLPPNQELTMPLKFKNAAGEVREMNVAVKLELYSAPGQFHWRLTALTCERNGAKIFIIDPARLKPLEGSLLHIFKGLVGGKDGIEAQLQKQIEARRAKQKSRKHTP